MTRTKGTLRRAFFVFTVVLVGASAAGAKSTELVVSWKNPQYMHCHVSPGSHSTGLVFLKYEGAAEHWLHAKY